MTLIFNRLLEVVNVHAHANFYPANLSLVPWFLSCRVNRILTMLKTILPSLPRAVTITDALHHRQQEKMSAPSADMICGRPSSCRVSQVNVVFRIFWCPVR